MNHDELLRLLVEVGAPGLGEVAPLAVVVACVYAFKGVSTEAPDREFRYAAFAVLVVVVAGVALM